MKGFRICLIALLLFVSIHVDAQHIYFASVGIADYPGTQNDLWLPANDARDLYRLYKTNTRASSVLLTNSEATKKRILSDAARLFGKAGKEDIAVLFFSGHGYPGGFVAYDQILAYDEIRQLFSHCKARNKMVFADACFSGDLRENTGTPPRQSGSSIMLFLSCRDNEYSIEDPVLRNGFFTTCLLRSLKGGADLNKDRIITAMELFKAVSLGVKRLSDDEQHPVMWGNFDNEMPVMIWK